MAKLFIVISTPVRTDDGDFAVVVSTIAGTNVNRFPSRIDAESYLRMMRGSLHMATGVPFDCVLVDGETDYLSLRQKVDQEVERLSGRQSALTTRLNKIAKAIFNG